MNIFVVNGGSSSIKAYLYRAEKAIWQAHVQWKNNFQDVIITVSDESGTITEKTHEKNVSAILKNLLSLPALQSIDVIGHRIVHGGSYFHTCTRITHDVKKKIKELAALAPLHNLSELENIEILEKQRPNTPQFAVFDTAFHHTLPEAAYIYPIPYAWTKKGIRRYGFHGISFQYCSQRTSEIIQGSIKKKKVIICHLGSGASLCALKQGKSIDTTMGFTPLDGLMMDTRSGSIDPGILLYLLQKLKVTPEKISQALYHKSGLLGVSDLSSDMRDIIAKATRGDVAAKRALEVYLHRLNSLLGSMIASLQGLDVLVFTAGIGENAPLIRQRVCENFSFLGVALDKKSNNKEHHDDCILSSSQSRVQVLLIHTQEALEIARQTQKAAK